jgi:hypothetical protein
VHIKTNPIYVRGDGNEGLALAAGNRDAATMKTFTSR